MGVAATLEGNAQREADSARLPGSGMRNAALWVAISLALSAASYTATPRIVPVSGSRCANRVVGLPDAHCAGKRWRRAQDRGGECAVHVQRRVGPVIDEDQVRVNARRIRDTRIEVGDSEDRRAVVAGVLPLFPFEGGAVADSRRVRKRADQRAPAPSFVTLTMNS